MTVASLLAEKQKDPERWHYTNLSFLQENVFTPATACCKDLKTLPAPVADHRLVFVNGIYCPDLSTAAGLPEGFIRKNAAKEISLHVDPQTCLALTPVEFLFVTMDKGVPQESETEISLTLGQSARLTLIERHITQGQAPKAMLRRANIILHDQAKLIHGKIVHGDKETAHISQTHVTAGQGSFFDHFSMILGGRLTHSALYVDCTAPLADTRATGIMLLKERENASLVCAVNHQAPHSTSRQNIRAVLDGSARGSFQGRIHVDREAQKTDAYQLCRALLLSEKAEMNAKPELEIYADDVKCSHGAALGDLDEESLFYLCSRGIPENEARALLIGAFIEEAAAQIPSKELADLVRREVQTWR